MHSFFIFFILNGFLISQVLTYNPIYPNNSSFIVFQYFQAGDSTCDSNIIDQVEIPNDGNSCTPTDNGYMTAYCDESNSWGYTLWNSMNDCKYQNGSSYESQSGNMGNCSYDGSDPPLFPSVLGFCGQSNPASPITMQKKVQSHPHQVGLILFMDSNCQYPMNDPLQNSQVPNPFNQSGPPFYQNFCYPNPFDSQGSFFTANCTSGGGGVAEIYFWEDEVCETVNEFDASSIVTPGYCNSLLYSFFVNEVPSMFWFTLYCPQHPNQ